jgi:hypothetical protein
MTSAVRLPKPTLRFAVAAGGEVAFVLFGQKTIPDAFCHA